MYVFICMHAWILQLTWVVDSSEKMDVIFKNHFITILFPVDRFGEVGPSSRTFFSDKGFTCLQLLDLIYAFYQVIGNEDFFFPLADFFAQELFY